jgi:hypothetical protein
MSPWSTYTRTKLQTADRAKEHLQRGVGLGVPKSQVHQRS